MFEISNSGITIRIETWLFKGKILTVQMEVLNLRWRLKGVRMASVCMCTWVDVYMGTYVHSALNNKIQLAQGGGEV